MSWSLWMVPSEPYAPRSLKISRGCGEFINTDCAARTCLSASAKSDSGHVKMYRPLPEGRRSWLGENFESGWRIRNSPIGEYNSFCCKKRMQKISDKWSQYNFLKAYAHCKIQKWWQLGSKCKQPRKRHNVSTFADILELECKNIYYTCLLRHGWLRKLRFTALRNWATWPG